MRAIRLREFGPPENLVLEELDDLTPGPGEARIAVAAAGVHVLDTHLRRGMRAGPREPLPLPTIPGREVAGTVDALGQDADPGWLGRQVVAHLGFVPGGYASQALARADSLHAIPDTLDEAAAVAMIGTGRTAMAILDVAGIGPDDVVVVTAAAGGLGTLLVQAAGAAGATVVGLAGSPAKAATARELGADVAEDYTRDGWRGRVEAALAGRAPTIVLDAVGGAEGRACLEMLAPGGHLVMYGWAPGGAPTRLAADDLFARGITASAAVGPRVASGLRDLEERALAAAARGRLRPRIDRFPLEAAAEAHRAIESRRTSGKVVLVP